MLYEVITVGEHLASYKVPSMISVQQDKLPRNPADRSAVGRAVGADVRQSFLPSIEHGYVLQVVEGVLPAAVRNVQVLIIV